MSYLVAAVLLIFFLRINRPNLVQFKRALMFCLEDYEGGG